MENLFFKRIVCMLIVTCLLTPLYSVYADDPPENYDVSLTDLWYEPPSWPCTGPIIIKTNVTNSGESNLQNFSVMFLIPAENFTLKTKHINLLETNETITLTLYWNMSIANKTLLVAADCFDVINETNESNNNDSVYLAIEYDYENYSYNDSSFSTWPTTWREAESWDYSYDYWLDNEWVVWDPLNPSIIVSNDEYTAQNLRLTDQMAGDWAIWNFTVISPGEYHFYIRHWVDNKGCSIVRLKWNDDVIGIENFTVDNGGGWFNWSYFGSMNLSTGSGTLKIESLDAGKIEIDNIRISYNPLYSIPPGTSLGLEGSTNHTIGYNNWPPNTPPTANDDTAITDEDTDVDINVLANDIDPNGSLATDSVNITSGPAHGNITDINIWTGEVTYSPDANYSGSDSFTYTVDDDQGATSNTATVNITTNAVNDQPKLLYPNLEPEYGDANFTYFNFSITYKDNECAPTDHYVIISGTGYPMDLKSIYQGPVVICEYNLSIKLPEGNYSHIYNFSDGEYYCTHPYAPNQVHPGPFVNSTSGASNISIDSYSIDDDYTGDSFGNNNSIIEGGEIIELSITLENNGSDDAIGVSASLSTTNPYITIHNNPVSFGDIPVEGSASGEFLVEVDIDFTGEYNVLFSLDIQNDTGYNWTDLFYVTVSEWIGLNYQYIKDKTQSLSYVIFNAYDIGDIEKGRAYGTKGEVFASSMIKNWMENLSIFDVVLRDRLNASAFPKLEVINYELQVDDGSGYKTVDCHIHPCWNKSCFYSKGSFDYSTLNYEFNYSDLDVKRRPQFPEFDQCIENNTQNIISAYENGTIYDNDSLLNYTFRIFETYYNFTFTNLNASNNNTWPVYMRDMELEPPSLGKYVFIDEDPWNNPTSSFVSNIENALDYFNIDRYSDLYMIWKKAKLFTQMLIWAGGNNSQGLFPNCVGLILHDFNDHTFNMVNFLNNQLPIIFINGSIGEPMYDDYSSYQLSFSIEQLYNTNVESYNVIGQINGSNPDKTVIISCLYDSWWNQGAADSAIGMGILMGVADYYDRHDITPNCNLQFIAFAGEEYGYLGGHDYILKIENDSEPQEVDINELTYLIDLNQLGFTDPNDEPLSFSVILNMFCNTDEIADIIDETDYYNRTDQLADLTYHKTIFGGPSNNYPISMVSFVPGGIDPVKSILLLKDTGWTMHHREGRKNGTDDAHTEGDVFEYYNPLDVHVSGEMILNLTLNLTTGYLPVLDVSVDSLDFGVLAKNSIEQVYFFIKDDDNYDNTTLYYQLVENCDWISVSPLKGESDGESDDITVTVNTNGLSYGYYQDMIEVSYTGGTTKVINVTCSVQPVDPIVNFTQEPSDPEFDQTIFFNSTSYDPDGTIMNWSWDFGDGQVYFGEQVTHSYSDINTNQYNVTHTVTDDENFTNETTVSVFVSLHLDTNISLYKGWNFISLPFNQSKSFDDIYIKYEDKYYSWSNACSILSPLINQYLFGWNVTIQSYTMVNFGDDDTLDPGCGYWLYSYKDCTMSMKDTSTGSDDYVSTIDVGWNIVGIPYNQPVEKETLLVSGIPWSNAVSNYSVSDYLFGWNQNSQSYIFSDTFIPGSCYWLYSYESFILSRAEGGSFADPENDAVWQLNLTASSNDTNVSMGQIVIGEHLNATDGEMNDIFDAPLAPAPPVNSYITLYSDDNLSIPFLSLSRDFRYWPDLEKTWNISVCFISNSLSNTTINLSWNISSLAESEYESILLYDNDTNSTVDMLTQPYSQFNMTANTSRDFRIICSNGALPIFENVTVSPDGGGFGEQIILSADVTNLADNIDVVKVNVTYPDDSSNNFTMTNTENDTYQYEFNDTWLTGTFEFMIWATDIHGNANHSSPYEFEIVANASIQVCTVKNIYTSEDFINVTDPPTSSTLYDIGYELLDENQVLHIWNLYDSYYFNTDSGIQLTNHFGEYWSHNVLMLGYYNNDNWNLIYRTDELTGFQKTVDTDEQTYVNATLWKDLAYQGYEFRLAIRYHLGLTDNELTVIPYIENLGDPIPYTLGFAWEINDIRIDDTPENDYILINDSYHWLDESLDLSFTNLSRSVYCWNETLNDSVVCGYEPIPYFHIQENLSDNAVRSLYLRWNPDINYKVWIQSQNDSYNAPVVLGIRVGTLDLGESKYTSLYWYDADQQVFYYDTNSPFETWTSNPGYMVDNNTSMFATTSIENDVQKLTGNSYPDIDPGSISKVEIRAYAKHTGYACSLLLRPVFKYDDGDDHEYMLSQTSSWSDWYDVTEDSNAPDWTWKDIETFDCDVESYDFHPLFGSTVYCAKVEIRVTYSPWTPPSITNPTPGYGSTNVSIQPQLGITVSDDNGDELDISWLSNCSGSWQQFAANNSVGNGTYYQTMNGANVNGQWWYWMLNVSDDHDYNLSSVFKFYTGTQSKLVNTGTTTIKGYLLMQVEFWNSSAWITDQVVIDDTTPRVLNASGVLGLDMLFNGLLETGDLSYGDGEYRVYVALCDPYGEVLEIDSEKLEAWWSFELDLI